ncbi:unnamed protein product, partial [Amoebophrya sp. A120]|eukprot:GSA120T00018493001.1
MVLASQLTNVTITELLVADPMRIARERYGAFLQLDSKADRVVHLDEGEDRVHKIARTRSSQRLQENKQKSNRLSSKDFVAPVPAPRKVDKLALMQMRTKAGKVAKGVIMED